MCQGLSNPQPRHRFRAAIGLFSYSYFPFRHSTLSNSYSHTLFTPLPTPNPVKLLLLQATTVAHRLLLRRSLPLCLHPAPSNSYSHTQYTLDTPCYTYSYNLFRCRLTLTQFSTLSYLQTLLLPMFERLNDVCISCYWWMTNTCKPYSCNGFDCAGIVFVKFCYGIEKKQFKKIPEGEQ